VNIRFALLAGVAPLVVVTAAHAHPSLVDSVPKAGAAVAALPSDVRLVFNEPLEASFSTLEVVDAGGKRVSDGRGQIEAAHPEAIAVHASGGSGAYRVRWSVVGRDGHRVSGEIGFTVR